MGDSGRPDRQARTIAKSGGQDSAPVHLRRDLRAKASRNWWSNAFVTAAQTEPPLRSSCYLVVQDMVAAFVSHHI